MPRPSRKTFDRGTFPLTSDIPVGIVWEGEGELESSMWEMNLRGRTKGKPGKELFGRGFCCLEAIGMGKFNPAKGKRVPFLGDMKSIFLSFHR